MTSPLHARWATRLRRAAACPLLLAATLLASAAPVQASTYEVIVLGDTRHMVQSRPHGMNQQGEVVGQASGPAGLAQPVKFRPGGGREDLAMRDGMPGSRGLAAAINQQGVIAGWIDSADGLSTFAFTEHHGRMTLLPAPSGGRPRVTGLNDHGDVVGEVSTTDKHCAWVCGFLIHRGQWRTLASFPDAVSTDANAINNNGLIVGTSYHGRNRRLTTRAVLWRQGQIQLLAGIDQQYAAALGLNELGEVVGQYLPPGGALLHAFRWRDGQVTDLDGMADSTSSARAVNGLGQVIGERSTPTRYGSFVTVDGRMQWLDDLLLPGPTGQWHLADVQAINDAGQIIGTGIDPEGHMHALLLNPVRP